MAKIILKQLFNALTIILMAVFVIAVVFCRVGGSWSGDGYFDFECDDRFCSRN